MKKLLVVIGICILVVAMPLTTAAPLLKSTHLNAMTRHGQTLMTNGTFEGEFAEKNETGYIPLGTMEGTFSGESWGTFTGVWSLYEGNTSGTIEGWYFSHIFIGQFNTTGVEGSNWFIGLFRVNTTDNSFVAGALVFGEDNYVMRYAMGTI